MLSCPLFAGIKLLVHEKYTMENKNFFIAALGASAGGHQALKEFFEHLPEPNGVAFVVVTHLLRGHFSILDQILSRYTDMPVQRMTGFDEIRPNQVYVMPENVKAYIKNGNLILEPREKDEIRNNTIDLFFHSLGEDQQENAIAIIFAGMGSDGLKGVQTIHDCGGTVLVQDPKSTPFKSMPDSIIREDNPDIVMTPAGLAANLLKIISLKKAVR